LLVFPKEGYMSIRHAFSLIGAALLSYAAIAFTNSTDLTAASLLKDSDRTPVTLVGCIQTESDYRRQHDIRKGGFLNSGAGGGDEFMLVDAHPGPGRELTEAEANCSTTTGGRAYELTGGREDDLGLEAFLGRRVEITGMLKREQSELEVGTSGVEIDATGGLDVGFDLKLFEVNIESVRELPIAVPQPAAAYPREAAPIPEPLPEPQPQVQQPAPQPAPVIPERLPRTASPLALTGLLGLLSLAGAFGLRTWRAR
jgi:hypothetical protein